MTNIRYSTIKIGLMIGLMHILSTSSFCVKASIPSIQSFSVEGCTTCKADTTDLPDGIAKAVQDFKFNQDLISDNLHSRLFKLDPNSDLIITMKHEAKEKLAFAYFSGKYSYEGDTISVTQNLKTAYSYFKELAENGRYYPGYYYCGQINALGGGGVEKDNKLAISYFRKFIALSDKNDQLLDKSYNQLATCYLHDGDSLMYFRTLKEGLDEGCTQVCSNLGDCYKSGIGVARSYNDAFKVFQKGLQSWDDYTVLVCKYCLALLYRDGNGCNKDLVKSKAMLEEVVQKGYMRAKYILAEDNYKNASYTTAFTYCNELYNSKDESLKDVRGAICTMLAKMYQFGRGVEANQAEAERWWKEAAECGETDATKIQKWLYSN
jgi:TPR repeat protein